MKISWRSTLCAILLLTGGIVTASDILLSGQEAFQRQDYRSAERLFAQAAATAESASQEEALFRQSQCNLYLGEPAKTRELLQKHEELFPNSKRLLRSVLRAESFMLENNFSAASDLLMPWIKPDLPPSEENLQLLFSCAYALQRQKGKLEAALQLYRQLEPLAANTSFAAQVRFSQIEALLRNGKLLESKQLLEQSKDVYSSFPEYTILEMAQMLGEKRLSELKEQLSKQAELQGPPQLLYFFYRELGNHFLGNAAPEALEYLQKAFDLAKNDYERRETMRQLIDGAFLLKQVATAEKWLKDYMTFFPNDEDLPQLHLNLAKLALSDNRPQDALQQLRQCMAQTAYPLPIRIQAAREGARINIASDRFAEADALLTWAAENSQNPEEQDSLYLELGHLRFAKENFSGALFAFTKADRSEGALQNESKFQQLQCLMELKKDAEAQKLAQYLQTVPEYRARALFRNGELSARNGNTEQALELYRIFLKEFPEHPFAPDVAFVIGQLEESAGNPTKAYEAYINFASRYKDHPAAPDAWYMAERVALEQNDLSKALQPLEALEQSYANSLFAIEGAFQYVDALRLNGQLQEAQTRLQIMYDNCKLHHNEFLPEILFEQASVAKDLEETGRGLVLLTELQEKFPDHARKQETDFLMGDLASMEQNYLLAAEAYQRATEKASSLQLPALGRLADCYFAMYSTGGNEDDLTEALNNYRKVLELSGNDSWLKIQTLYRYGRALESLPSKQNEALDQYYEVLYLALSRRKQGADFAPVWTAKAGYAALRLEQKLNDTPEGAEAIRRIIQILQELNLDSGDNFSAIEEALYNKYQWKQVERQ